MPEGDQRDPSYASDEISDRSLLRRLRSGNPDAATQLYLRYANRLNALARSQTSPELAQRVDTEDIVQSVFGSFFRRAQTGYYDVPEGEELWKLFLVIALNKIRTKAAYHKAAKRDVRATVQGDAIEACNDPVQGDQELALRALEMTIDEAMESLPDHYREILTLRIEGYDIDAIALHVKRSKRTVERILQELRKNLSHLLYE
ncbi:MAG: sigma-70 family RNA polymerase sigma factor [Planctomycetales bacterium]|nr:sigma-70 family RNA polymerase sigma factor [Planctomycetales bacterium]